MIFSTEQILLNFRTSRYASLNEARWKHFLWMGIKLAGKRLFEPGAGIGDQTQWLLAQGASHIYVNDGRPENLEYIQKRFEGDSRLTFVQGELEKCLDEPQFQFQVDFIYCYGVYYHLNESLEDMNIMRKLSRIGPTIAFDFLVGTNKPAFYGYDNPSTSLSQWGIRPETSTLMQKLKEVWGYAYLPKEQLPWKDPENSEPRLIGIASRVPLNNPNLTAQ